MATEATSPRTVPTRTFRLAPDLSEKLSEILAVEDVTSANFLDPLVRTEIENRYAANKAAIDTLRIARERARRIRDEAPALANDLAGEV
jgi:hypothetical protein